MKFLVDRMLGKLAKGLRMVGYDAVYYQGQDLQQLIQWARCEERVILTRNTKLIPKRPEDRIVRVVDDHPSRQLRELIQTGLIALSREKLFSRCLLCNVSLTEIRRSDAEGKVPDFIYYSHDLFFQCPQCKRIYWKGSHQGNMQRRIEELFQAAGSNANH